MSERNVHYIETLVNAAQTYILVAEQIPAIWDVVGPLSLNPQPLPPGPPDEVYADLNPQPLPPGPPPETYGAYAGRELVRLSWTASKLGQPLVYSGSSTWVAELVPRGEGNVPTLPPWLPPIDDSSPEWVRAYLLGFTCALAIPVAAKGITSDEWDFLTELFNDAYDVLGGPRQPIGGPPHRTVGPTLQEPDGGPRQPDRPPPGPGPA